MHHQRLLQQRVYMVSVGRRLPKSRWTAQAENSRNMGPVRGNLFHYVFEGARKICGITRAVSMPSIENSVCSAVISPLNWARLFHSEWNEKLWNEAYLNMELAFSWPVDSQKHRIQTNTRSSIDTNDAQKLLLRPPTPEFYFKISYTLNKSYESGEKDKTS